MFFCTAADLVAVVALLIVSSESFHWCVMLLGVDYELNEKLRQLTSTVESRRWFVDASLLVSFSYLTSTVWSKKKRAAVFVYESPTGRKTFKPIHQRMSTTTAGELSPASVNDSPHNRKRRSSLRNMIEETRRATVQNPSRPFTPRDNNRKMFMENEYSNRPQSAFSINSSHFDAKVSPLYNKVCDNSAHGSNVQISCLFQVHHFLMHLILPSSIYTCHLSPCLLDLVDCWP